MFAVELQRRAAAAGIGGTSVAVDPGTATTDLQRHVSGMGAALGRALIKVIGYPTDRVAENVLYATTPDKPTDATFIAPSRFILACDSAIRDQLASR